MAAFAAASAAAALTREKHNLSLVRPGDEPPVVTLAKEDLAMLLGIDVDDVSVLSVEPVEWPDTSLGNPQPDLLYLQIITPGYKFVLEAGDFPYTYHSDLNEQVELVSTPEKPAA